MIYENGTECKLELLKLGLEQLRKNDLADEESIEMANAIIEHENTIAKFELERDSRVKEAIERFKGEISFIMGFIDTDNDWFELSQTFRDVRNVLDEIEYFVENGDEEEAVENT